MIQFYDLICYNGINKEMIRLNFIPRIDIPMERVVAEQMNPINLAFIGDSVQTLYLRAKYVISSDHKTGQLHKMVADQINATNQSKAVEHLLDSFTDIELGIFKRARNSKINTSAKNASIIDYKRASGLEAVIGYLYLTGQDERLGTVLEKAVNHDN